MRTTKASTEEAVAEIRELGEAQVEALARDITTDLFTSGCGAGVAKRLVLEMPDTSDGGGWCMKAAFDRVGAKIHDALLSTHSAGVGPDSCDRHTPQDERPQPPAVSAPIGGKNPPEMRSDHMWPIVDGWADSDSVPGWVAKSILSDLRSLLPADEAVSPAEAEPAAPTPATQGAIACVHVAARKAEDITMNLAAALAGMRQVQPVPAAESSAVASAKAVSPQLADDIGRILDQLTSQVEVAAEGPRLAVMEHIDAIAALTKPGARLPKAELAGGSAKDEVRKGAIGSWGWMCGCGYINGAMSEACEKCSTGHRPRLPQLFGYHDVEDLYRDPPEVGSPPPDAAFLGPSWHDILARLCAIYANTKATDHVSIGHYAAGGEGPFASQLRLTVGMLREWNGKEVRRHGDLLKLALITADLCSSFYAFPLKNGGEDYIVRMKALLISLGMMSEDRGRGAREACKDAGTGKVAAGGERETPPPRSRYTDDKGRTREPMNHEAQWPCGLCGSANWPDINFCWQCGQTTRPESQATDQDDPISDLRNKIREEGRGIGS